MGCIPTKYLVDKALAMDKVRALVKKDIFRDAGTFSFKKIQAGKAEVTGKLVGGVQFLLKKQGVQVVTGEAELEGDRVGLLRRQGVPGEVRGHRHGLPAHDDPHSRP